MGWYWLLYVSPIIITLLRKHTLSAVRPDTVNMVKSGSEQSRSRSGSGTPTIKFGRASHLDATLNSPDDAGRLASAKTTLHQSSGLQSSLVPKFRSPKNNHKFTMGKKAGMFLDDMDNEDAEYESLIELSLCSESQMSLSAVSSNSESIVRRLERLSMKLEALKSSYLDLEFKAKLTFKKYGFDSDQYISYFQNIEKKKFEIVSINQISAYNKSLLDPEDNPITNP